MIIKASKDFFIDDVKAVFIETPTGLAPYFVKSLTQTNSGFIIEMEDVNAIEKAKLLIGKHVFISAELINEKESRFEHLLVDDDDALALRRCHERD